MISKKSNNLFRIKTGSRQTNSVQAEPTSWTKDQYLEEIQVVVNWKRNFISGTPDLHGDIKFKKKKVAFCAPFGEIYLRCLKGWTGELLKSYSFDF